MINFFFNQLRDSNRHGPILSISPMKNNFNNRFNWPQMILFLTLSCYTHDDIGIKEEIKISSYTPTTKTKSLINARISIPGKLIWDGSNYEADFGDRGTLIFSGPNPLPQNNAPIVIFHVLSTKFPIGNISVSDTDFNTFSETILFASLYCPA
ncbi:MAG: hypothetical protein ACKVOQ_00955 [Cyclobacteriaceae bacterium]